MNKFIYTFIITISSLFIGSNVLASTFNPTDDLLSSTQSDNLLLIANSQIDNFTDYYYSIFRVDLNYYLVASKDYTLNSNNIVFNNSIIISAIRSDYSNYSYSTYSDSNGYTTVYLDKLIISNVNTSKSVSSDLFIDLKFNNNVVRLLMFILGISFGLFLIKDRRSI